MSFHDLVHLWTKNVSICWTDLFMPKTDQKRHCSAQFAYKTNCETSISRNVHVYIFGPRVQMFAFLVLIYVHMFTFLVLICTNVYIFGPHICTNVCIFGPYMYKMDTTPPLNLKLSHVCLITNILIYKRSSSLPKYIYSVFKN